MDHTISLEQWQTFKTVVDAGSFAAAADLLNKSQSSVSYTLAKLAERSPTPLLIQEGRKAVLTEAGKAMYRQASHLLEQAKQAEAALRYLATGWENEVVIALDAIASTKKLFCGLHAFSIGNPRTRVRVLETTLSGTDEAILSKQADIALTGRIPTGYLGEQIGSTTMVAVAHISHPLCRLEAPVSELDLQRYRQIVVRDSGLKRQQDAGWLGSEERWTVSHFSSSIEAVKAGLGFAFIPEDKIQKDLQSGDLQRINLSPSNERLVPLYLVLTNQSNAGPATKAIANQLINSFKTI